MAMLHLSVVLWIFKHYYPLIGSNMVMCTCCVLALLCVSPQDRLVLLEARFNTTTESPGSFDVDLDLQLPQVHPCIGHAPGTAGLKKVLKVISFISCGSCMPRFSFVNNHDYMLIFFQSYMLLSSSSCHRFAEAHGDLFFCRF